MLRRLTVQKNALGAQGPLESDPPTGGTDIDESEPDSPPAHALKRTPTVFDLLCDFLDRMFTTNELTGGISAWHQSSSVPSGSSSAVLVSALHGVCALSHGFMFHSRQQKKAWQSGAGVAPRRE